MEETKLRKYEHALVISGVGVIAFGLWSVVKATLYFILIPLEDLASSANAEELATLQSMGMTAREMSYLIAAAIIFSMIVDFALRLYIGKSAVTDGRHLKKKRFIYVVWAMFIAVGLVLNLVMRCVQLAIGDGTIWGDVMTAANVSVVVDITSLLALVEMIIAAIMVRRLRRELGIDETEVA